MGKVVGHPGQAEFLDQSRARPLAAAGRAGQASREQHVLVAAQLLDQLKGLEHEPDVAQPGPRQRPGPLPRSAPAGQPDLARVRPVEAAEEMQQGRLAAARAPEDGDHLTRRDLDETRAGQDAALGSTAAYRLGDPASLENGHGSR